MLRRGSEYPLFDGHGSERTVTNSIQTVTGSVNYEAFGQVVGTTGSSTSPYLYAGDWGYRNDGDVGHMHVGARYYDAQVGRFISRDMDLGQHAYLYCLHEPLSYVDPDGAGPRDGSGGKGKGKGRGKGSDTGKGPGKPWWWPATITVSVGVVSATCNGGDLWRGIPPGDRAKLRNAKELGIYMLNRQ
ncbi:MAG: RHS repeat-associated core domain-containing protein [Armatimonadetes bacterium]|nr:RHS repeat-associated core domain-containing protein [Armatimonadota bacterium]